MAHSKLQNVEAGAVITTLKKKSHVLEDFFFFRSIAFLLTCCSLIFLITTPLLIWVPSWKNFLFVSLPKLGNVLSSSKYIFLVGNLIIILLIAESKLLSSHYFSVSASEVYYNEYIKRRIRVSNNFRADQMKIEMRSWEEKGLKKTDDMEREEELLRKKKSLQVEKEDDEEMILSFPMEELEKRADDFIARVNRRRRFEAANCTCFLNN